LCISKHTGNILNISGEQTSFKMNCLGELNSTYNKNNWIKFYLPYNQTLNYQILIFENKKVKKNIVKWFLIKVYWIKYIGEVS
jgi:hypothetical protein